MLRESREPRRILLDFWKRLRLFSNGCTGRAAISEE
jgi:hypothetical protein